MSCIVWPPKKKCRWLWKDWANHYASRIRAPLQNTVNVVDSKVLKRISNPLLIFKLDFHFVKSFKSWSCLPFFFLANNFFFGPIAIDFNYCCSLVTLLSPLHFCIIFCLAYLPSDAHFSLDGMSHQILSFSISADILLPLGYVIVPHAHIFMLFD